MTAPAAPAGAGAGAGAGTAFAAGAAGGAAAGAAATQTAAPQTLAGTSIAFYALLSSLAEDAGLIAAGSWDLLDPGNILGSWENGSLLDRVMLTTSIAQELAATSAGQYIRAAIDGQSGLTGGGLLLAPKVFAGIASDGRNMDDLLRSPLIATMTALSAGVAVGGALYLGRNQLRRIVSTQVTDTGRQAAQVAMTADDRVNEYVRMLTPPSCGRCAVLAGRRFRVSEAFLRHPR